MKFRIVGSGLWIAASVLLCAGLVRAEEHSDPESVLRKTSMFAMGGVGVAGSMSEGERALREILNQPDATAKLEKMLPEASPAGQLYLLVALRERDRAAYQRAVGKVGGNDATVETARGCILQKENFRDLVKQIEKGNYDSYLSRTWPKQAR